MLFICSLGLRDEVLDVLRQLVRVNVRQAGPIFVLPVFFPVLPVVPVVDLVFVVGVHPFFEVDRLMSYIMLLIVLPNSPLLLLQPILLI